MAKTKLRKFMREKMIPGQIDTGQYKQVTLQSDYDRDGKLILGFDDQGDIYIQTDGYVRFAATSGSRVSPQVKEMLRDIVEHEIEDIKIGSEIRYNGKTYVCKLAPKGSDDCEGCAFDSLCRNINSPCVKYICTDSERGDNNNIIFVEKGDLT